MASSRSFEIGTGLFILLGFAAVAFLATQTTSLAGYRQGESYGLTARFTNIGQLKDRAPVKLAGVTIGSVRNIVLDGRALDAVVTIDIDTRFNEIPDDSSLSIYTSGLLGDQYVAIKPGGSPDFMAEGGEFVLTESSVQLEELIGKYLVGGEGGKPNAGTTDAGD